MFHSFFNSLARYLSLCSLPLNFTLWSAGTAKSTILQVPLFLLIIMSGRLAKIQWSICMSKSQRSLCVLFTKIADGLCIYHLFVWLNLNFPLNSQRNTLPTLLFLVLYSFCANLLHSLIMWLIVSSLSPHNNLHLLFCCVLSIIVLILLVLKILFCAANRKDSVFFLTISYVHGFSCEMLLISCLKCP